MFLNAKPVGTLINPISAMTQQFYQHGGVKDIGEVFFMSEKR